MYHFEAGIHGAAIPDDAAYVARTCVFPSVAAYLEKTAAMRS